MDNSKTELFESMPIPKAVVTLSVPSVISSLVMVIYSLADTFFVGMMNDPVQNAAVTLAAPLLLAFNAVNNLFGIGSSSMMSRALGRKDYDTVYRSSAFGFYASLICSLLFSLLYGVLQSPILVMLGANAETIQATADYLFWTVLLGSAPSILNVVLAYLVRAEGSSLHASIGTMSGWFLNIILDPILISGLGMGALGAAVATVIGYLCSVMYFLLVLRKKSHCLSVKLSQCHVRADELRQILGVGITAALSNLMQSLTVIVINQFLLAYGNDKIAAMGIVLKVNMIAQLILTGFAFGGVPMYGYLYGAKQQDTLKKLLRFCLLFLCGLSLALTAFLCLAATPLMRLFVQDSALVATGAEMLRWQAATAVFAGIVLLLTVLFQATGKIVPAFLLSISRQGIVFIVVLVVCVRLFAYNGVIMAQAVADVLSAILALGLLIGYNPLKQ